jgi:hypothetical protein
MKVDPSQNEQDLGESDSEEPYDSPPGERKVITQPVDLSVQTLIEQWESKLLILPEIQREYVWDNGKASRLIESLLLSIPIPVLYFAETPEATYEIIDGHQRVRSIARFIANEFPLSGLNVLPEFRGLRFHQLPPREQRFLKMRTLRAIIISVDSHPTMKFEVFERLNTGSISLNAQELRNSIYRGSLNKLLRELAKSDRFRAVIGTKNPRPRMVDEELILRFFALRVGLGSYRPPLKKVLNDFMNENRNADEEERTRLKEMFELTVRRVEGILSNAAFRVTDASGKRVENAVNRALFDSQMLACSWISAEPSSSEQGEAKKALAALHQDESFRDAIQRATGDRSRTLTRLRAAVAALRGAGVEVSPPFALDK